MFHCLNKNCLPLLDVACVETSYRPPPPTVISHLSPNMKIRDSLALQAPYFSLKIKKKTFPLHSFCEVLCIWLGVLIKNKFWNSTLPYKFPCLCICANKVFDWVLVAFAYRPPVCPGICQAVKS